MRIRVVHPACAALVVAFLAAPVAHADTSLTLTSADVPGLRPAGTGSKVAGSALGGKLPRALKGVSPRGAAFSGSGGRSLRMGIYVTRNSATAGTALRQARGKGFKGLAGIGDGASRRTTSTRKATTSVVVVRVGAAVGFVRFAVSGREPTLAANAAQGYAAALAQRLRRVLAMTEFARTLDGIKADGSITPQLALRAFSIAYGPLPGVTVPKGTRLGAPQSGTLAMQLVARVWDQLTPAQRTAIDRALGAPHDATSAPVARSAAQILTPSAQYQALADVYVNVYRGKFPGVTTPVRVFTASEEITPGNGFKVWADALPVNAAGQWGTGSPSYCRVRVPPMGQAEAGKPFFNLIIAHEVFHCFQFQMMSAWRQRSAWIIEGSADWAATSVVPTTAAVGAGPYKEYLSSPGKSLFARSYDATGFWHWIDSLGTVGSLWPKIPAILNAPDDNASFLVAGGGADLFVESWASAIYRYRGAGQLWRQTRPYDIAPTTVPSPLSVVVSATTLASNPHQTSLYDVVNTGTQPLVSVIGLRGKLRAGTDKKDFGIVSGQRYFCFGKCKCPPKSVGEIPAHETVSGKFLSLALTGGADDGGARVTFQGIEALCKKKPDPGPSGPAESNGDPHMTTLDGLHFDFQAAGEFVLARSKSRDLEVQARQEPGTVDDLVTVNTQIAARIGGGRVTVGPGATTSDGPVVRVGGQVDPLPVGTFRAVGDGTLTRQPTRDVEVKWADGSLLVVRSVGVSGVAMVLQLAGARAGEVTGLLGNFNDDPADDLADRKGKRMAYTVRGFEGWDGLKRYTSPEEFSTQFFDALYGGVGKAWRISQAESLLDYGPGQTTATFTKPKVPKKSLALQNLPPARRTEADALCRGRGVTQKGPLTDCILDVFATGNAAFADEAFAAQEGASAVWTQLRGARDIESDLSIARDGAGVLHVAFTRESPGLSTRPATSIAVGPSGNEGAEEAIGAALSGDPALFTAADGSVRAAVAEVPPTGSQGIYRYARAANGAWSPTGRVTTFGDSYLGRPSALAVGDVQLTVSPMDGAARLFRGVPAPGEGVPVPASPGCTATSPGIARDAVAGTVFVAWVQWNCAQEGIFVAQVDPATGAFSGAPVQAPGSNWNEEGRRPPSFGVNKSRAFTGRPGQPGVFLAYEAAPTRVALWRVGAPSATTFTSKEPVLWPRIAADPAGGRMWVLWRGVSHLSVQRTTPDGAADGAVRPIAFAPNPSGQSRRLFDEQISARGGGLDVVMGYQGGDTVGGLYRTHLAP
jgi:hypothetical protein